MTKGKLTRCDGADPIGCNDERDLSDMVAKRSESPRSKSQTDDPKWLKAWQRKQKSQAERNGFPLALKADDLSGWLVHAVTTKDLDATVKLIAAGASVDPVPEWEGLYSPLQVATIQGNLDLVKILIASGADPNHVGRDGTALMCSVGWRRLDVYHYLVPLTDPREQAIVARRVSEARRNDEEQTRAIRFSEVTFRGLKPTFLKLLDQGIDVDSRTAAYLGKTPLALASQANRLEMAERLIKAGADPNLESYTGVTPLMLVSKPEICRRLIAAGAVVNLEDDQGRNALARVKDEECLQLIRRASGKVERT